MPLNQHKDFIKKNCMLGVFWPATYLSDVQGLSFGQRRRKAICRLISNGLAVYRQRESTHYGATFYLFAGQSKRLPGRWRAIDCGDRDRRFDDTESASGLFLSLSYP